ncbi:MAG: helix-turn-helix transcriptional regulator [Syntrophales bacterium]
MATENKESDARRNRGFLRLPQVLEIFPISKSTWWKGIKEGRFPKPIKLTERTSVWSRVEIDALCEKFVASGVEKKCE